ncbi:MAG TPA: hypothetical protein DDW98_12665 [Gammaproteobacteria bacterium]|nr:hypothetical protein [Gammaproteobacteria bacterium]
MYKVIALLKRTERERQQRRRYRAYILYVMRAEGLLAAKCLSDRARNVEEIDSTGGAGRRRRIRRGPS